MARWGARPMGDGRNIADQNLQQANMMPGREHHPSSAATAPSRRRTIESPSGRSGCERGIPPSRTWLSRRAAKASSGGALPAVVGTVGGREVEGMCPPRQRRTAGSRKAAPSANAPARATRKRAAIRAAYGRDPAPRVAASGRIADATSLPNRAANCAVTKAKPSAGPLLIQDARALATEEGLDHRPAIGRVWNRPPTSGPPSCRRHASPARTRSRARSLEKSSRCVRGEGPRPLLAKGRCRGEGGSRRRPGPRSRQ